MGAGIWGRARQCSNSATKPLDVLEHCLASTVSSRPACGCEVSPPPSRLARSYGVLEVVGAGIGGEARSQGMVLLPRALPCGCASPPSRLARSSGVLDGGSWRWWDLGGRDRRRSQVSGHVFCFLAPCLRLCTSGMHVCREAERPKPRGEASSCPGPHPSPSPGHEKKNKQIEARPARSGVVPALASSAAYLSFPYAQIR